MLYLAPKTPTRSFPMHLLQLPKSSWIAKFGLLNRASYALYDYIAWRPLRALVDRFRVQELGISRLPFWTGPRERAHRLGMLTVYSYSERCVPVLLSP